MFGNRLSDKGCWSKTISIYFPEWRVHEIYIAPRHVQRIPFSWLWERTDIGSDIEFRLNCGHYFRRCLPKILFHFPSFSKTATTSKNSIVSHHFFSFPVFSAFSHPAFNIRLAWADVAGAQGREVPGLAWSQAMILAAGFVASNFSLSISFLLWLSLLRFLSPSGWA